MYTPVSFEQPTHPELILPIDPHQREAADARCALVKPHQYSISLAASGCEPLTTDGRGSRVTTALPTHAGPCEVIASEHMYLLLLD